MSAIPLCHCSVTLCLMHTCPWMVCCQLTVRRRMSFMSTLSSTATLNLLHLSVQQFAGCVHFSTISVTRLSTVLADRGGSLILDMMVSLLCSPSNKTSALEESLLCVFSACERFPTVCRPFSGAAQCFKCATLLSVFWRSPLDSSSKFFSCLVYTWR